MTSRTVFYIIRLLVMLTAPIAASADYTSYEWLGGTGDWNDSGNWNPVGIPSRSSGDTAVINESHSVVQIANSASATHLNVLGDYEIQMISGSSQFTFGKKQSADPNPTFANSGTFRMTNTGSAKHIYTTSNLSISGSGRLLMEDPASKLDSASNVSITQGSGHTIRGSGIIEPHDFFNNGNVETSGGRLLMYQNFHNNSGATLSAAPGELLQFGYITGSSGKIFRYYGNGGWIDLNGGGILVENASFRHVNIMNSGAGGAGVGIEFDKKANYVDFEGLTYIASGVELNFNDATMFADVIGEMKPTITNDGIITIKDNNSSDGTSARFIGRDGTTLTGSGRLVLDGAQAATSGSLINDVNHTIEGQGRIDGPVTNHGTLLANNGLLVIDEAAVSGDGTIRVESGSHLYVATAYSRASTMSAGDLTLHQGAQLTVDGGGSSGMRTVDVHGDFVNHITDPTKFRWLDTTKLKMSGDDTTHFLEVAGRTDLADPLTNNFALSILDIAGDIALVDLFDNQPGFDGTEALYVNELVFSGSTLNLNGIELWTNDPSTGQLMQVAEGSGGEYGWHIVNNPVPIPGALWLMVSALLGLSAAKRTKKQGQTLRDPH